MTDTHFIPGLELAEAYYGEVIAPILAESFFDLPHAAGLIGPGSDVLGYDTSRSMDHDWGPRCVLVLTEADLQTYGASVDHALATSLPRTFRGFSTGFDFHSDGTTRAADGEANTPVRHRVTITSVSRLLQDTLGISRVAELSLEVWVTASQQSLLHLTAGKIFRDDLGDLTEVRNRLCWFPDDVWRYLMAGAWKNIAQLEPFIGRCGEVGDDLGSQLVAMRVLKDQLSLAFLQERAYAPYQKWFGTAFARLEIAPRIATLIEGIRFGRTWQQREAASVRLSSMLVERHNALSLSAPCDGTPRRFHERPFTIIDAERIADALHAAIDDPRVRLLPRDLGGIDTWVDSTDAIVNSELRHMLRGWLVHRDA